MSGQINGTRTPFAFHRRGRVMEMNPLLSGPFRADKMKSGQIRPVMKSPSMGELLSLVRCKMRISFNSSNNNRMVAHTVAFDMRWPHVKAIYAVSY